MTSLSLSLSLSLNAFGENITLITTTSRYYASLLTQANQLINNIDKKSSTRVTLMITENKSNKSMALQTQTSWSIGTPYT